MTAREIARHLKGRKSGINYLACCPAHDDRNPSLSLKDVDGKVLVKCHAGCEQAAVVAALKACGLWELGKKEPDRRIIATYDYTDESGSPLYQIVRFEPKDFRPRYLDGDGRWIWRKHPRQVLYHLPEVLEAPIVFVVEGERDVETLRDYGFCATTIAGGAKAPWLPQFSEALRGREVILIPDNDRPGWERAAMIARALFGVGASIIVFDLPPATKDITDWFHAGHSECELIALLEGVHAD